MKGKVPQNKDLQRNSLPSETSIDYTKCMKLTKKHGIVSENMEYTRMFWSLILPIHHNMKHEMATFCETIIHNFYFHAPYTKYRAPGVMDYGSQPIPFHHCMLCFNSPKHVMLILYRQCPFKNVFDWPTLIISRMNVCISFVAF